MKGGYQSFSNTIRCPPRPLKLSLQFSPHPCTKTKLRLRHVHIILHVMVGCGMERPHVKSFPVAFYGPVHPCDGSNILLLRTFLAAYTWPRNFTHTAELHYCILNYTDSISSCIKLSLTCLYYSSPLKRTALKHSLLPIYISKHVYILYPLT